MPRERLLGKSHHKTENTCRLFNSDYENWQTVKLVKKSVAVVGLDT